MFQNVLNRIVSILQNVLKVNTLGGILRFGGN